MRTERIGIIGCGLIGASWALTFARAGCRVQVWQRGEASVLDRIRQLAAAVADTGSGLSADDWPRISAHREIGSALEGVSYVQESIAEDLGQKADIITQIETLIDGGAFIASSTSGLLPSAMSRRLKTPERFLVAHTLALPHLLPVTEICPAPETAPHVTNAVAGFLKDIGQTPIVLRKEIAGFATNRLLGVLLNELFALIADGVLDPLDADAIFTDGFGLRWAAIGPLAAMDLNAVGGIREYLTRYGRIFAEVARSRGMENTLSDEVIDRVAASLAASSPNPQSARAAQRDRTIAQLKAARSAVW